MNNRGQAMIIAVFVIVVIALLGMLNIYMLSGGGVSAVKNLYGIQALNVAEGGIRFTIAASLAADSDWSNNVDIGPLSLNPGTFTVHYTYKSQTACSLEVTGTVSGVSRKVAVGLSKGGTLPEAFNYALYWRNSAGTLSRFNIGAAGLNPTLVVGNCFLNGNGSVYTGSSVTSGKIYVPPGRDVNGGGTYSWEVTSTPPPWPALDNSYYINLINKYNSHIPTTPAPAYPDPNGPVIITLNGNIVTYESISVNWPLGSLTVLGSGELISRGNFTVNGALTVRPITGETIALVANNTMTISSRLFLSTNLQPGTHLYSRNGELIFNKVLALGTVYANGILLMSGVRVTLNWYGSEIGASSIIYIPTYAVGLQKFLESVPFVVDISYSDPDIYYGSILCDCTDASRWVKFNNGIMTGIIYSPVCPVRLFGDSVSINGALAADQVNSLSADRTLDANITWAPGYLPSFVPPGLGGIGLTFYNWREIY